MQNFLIALCVLFTLPSIAQKTTVLEKLKLYNIDSSALVNMSSKAFKDEFAFDLNTTSVIADKQKNVVASYDASKQKDKWTIKSVDGHEPSSADKNAFLKQYDADIAASTPDESSYNIVEDNPSEIVVSYKYDAALLTDQTKFLGDCIIKLYISKQTHLLEKAVLQNLKPFKIKVVKVTNMLSATTYKYLPDDKNYVPVKDEITMSMSMLAQPVEETIVSDYSNYQKKQ